MCGQANKSIKKRTIARNVEKTHEDGCENFIFMRDCQIAGLIPPNSSALRPYKQRRPFFYIRNRSRALMIFFKLIARPNLYYPSSIDRAR
jgi:hypothetical protein